MFKLNYNQIWNKCRYKNFEYSLKPKLATTFNSNFPDKSCSKCKTRLSTSFLFCDNCNTLQTIDKGTTFFQCFGISAVFKLDLNQISNRFKYLQKQLHPDKFVNKSKTEQDLSNQCSSLVNRAYQTLAQDYERGKYLLKLKGLSLENSDEAIIDSSFLEEMIDYNDQINSPDCDLSVLKKEVEEKMTNLVKKIAVSFNEQNLNEAKKLLQKLKFLSNIKSRIDAKEFS